MTQTLVSWVTRRACATLRSKPGPPSLLTPENVSNHLFNSSENDAGGSIPHVHQNCELQSLTTKRTSCVFMRSPCVHYYGQTPPPPSVQPEEMHSLQPFLKYFISRLWKLQPAFFQRSLHTLKILKLRSFSVSTIIRPLVFNLRKCISEVILSAF